MQNPPFGDGSRFSYQEKQYGARDYKSKHLLEVDANELGRAIAESIRRELIVHQTLSYECYVEWTGLFLPCIKR